VSLAVFVDLLLYFRDGPTIENTIGRRVGNAYHWYNSRRQLVYRIAHRLAEIVHLLSIHSPGEGSTDLGAEQPKIDIIPFVDHCVLAVCEPDVFRRREEGNLPGSW